MAFGRRVLAEAGVPDASRDAALLLAGILGVETARLHLDHQRQVPAREESQYRQYLARRSRCEPLQYILGRVEFMGLPFRVDSRVLIPRPETERLVETALEELNRLCPPDPASGQPYRPDRTPAPNRPVVADLGTGSGCIAVSLARYRADLEVRAFDLAAGALEVARENAEANGVAERIRFLPGDILDPVFTIHAAAPDTAAPGAAALDTAAPDAGYWALISNPPYVSADEVSGLQEEVRDYEPRLAVATPGSDAYVFYRRLAELAAASLIPGGFLAVEVGAGMAERVAGLFEENGLQFGRFVEDYGGHRRVVLAYPAVVE